MQKNLKNIITDFTKEGFSDYLLPHIIFNSCSEVLIEGSKGILEYNTDSVRINGGRFVLKFVGEDLSIRALNYDEIIINGTVAAFEFCSV